MIKKILLPVNTLLILLVIGFILFDFGAEKEKIAYVDSNKLLTNYQGMISARKAYNAKLVTWQANIDSLSLDLERAIKKFEKESISMSEKEIALSKELLRTKQQNLADYQKAIQEKAKQEDQQLTRDVVNTVNAYLLKYGKENHYNIIFAATEIGNIVYADNAIDITDKVLNGLNGAASN
jgi:outer membrane protein